MVSAKTLLMFIQPAYIFCTECAVRVLFASTAALNSCPALMWVVSAPLPRHLVYLCAIAVAIMAFPFVLANLAPARVAIYVSLLHVKLGEWFDGIAIRASSLSNRPKTDTFCGPGISFLLAAEFAYGMVVVLMSAMLVKFAEWLDRIANSAALQVLLRKTVTLKSHVSFQAIDTSRAESIKRSRTPIKLCGRLEESTSRTTLERHVTSAGESAFVEWGRRGADGPRFSGRLPSPSLLYIESCGL